MVGRIDSQVQMVMFKNECSVVSITENDMKWLKNSWEQLKMVEDDYEWLKCSKMRTGIREHM